MATKANDVLLSDSEVSELLICLDTQIAVWKRRVNAERDAVVKKHYEDGVIRLQNLSGKIRGGVL